MRRRYNRGLHGAPRDTRETELLLGQTEALQTELLLQTLLGQKDVLLLGRSELLLHQTLRLSISSTRR